MNGPQRRKPETAPGDKRPEASDVGSAVRGYAIGLVLAVGMTAVSFYIVHSPLIWTPGIPMGLIVLAIAQMGVHLVFFLHVNTGPDSTNTTLALAFGLLIVFLIIAGSLFIMTNLNHNMLPMDQVMQMQR
ncbi:MULTISPECIES: cytochrome o ubiquinol oxidase subunit IV [Sphingosinicellaceae]|uniref:cytochrome o ubiquinol oxidase subunit IV n=1 Tax=Sphingosinicellaceae TaxID=2820280 RepID=UPI001C1E4900|nr:MULTISPECIES: cytochrome o ubiquinol oxidase subunit IV [Polymorphobacter]QYE35416.1 cytochrome o ubiquinol oxidase subunit IV [Polymorphobacter sp. PAMC 29334]UAJ11273.1 cytochrome o ubiquinol oxidase subunit IV [Polymorphobacter megasporae]